MKLATNIGRENLISIGTCFGKFTKVLNRALATYYIIVAEHETSPTHIMLGLPRPICKGNRFVFFVAYMSIE